MSFAKGRSLYHVNKGTWWVGSEKWQSLLLLTHSNKLKIQWLYCSVSQGLKKNWYSLKITFYSSSGTTTSGSVATVELLQRLKRLEMPSLKRPTVKTSPLDKDDLNTSADLKKASELDSSPAIETSFRFSTDLGDTSGCAEDNPTHVLLSSCSSWKQHIFNLLH